jgi:DNA-binding beta-propeller fold protein YncE
LRSNLIFLLLVHLPVLAGSHVYAPLASSLITSLNTSSGSQSITGPVGLNAQIFFLAPDGKTFFVTFEPGALEAIQPASGREVSFQTTYPVFTNFLSTTPFARTLDGSKLLVGTCAVAFEGACEEGFVEVFSTVSAKELALISFNSDEVTGIAVSPNGGKAYVTHQYEEVCTGCDARPTANGVPPNAITAVSLVTLTAGRSLRFKSGPGKLVIDPTGSLAYVAPRLEPEISPKSISRN